jgi:predicted HAD superfamily Cof-like phosphohydrolase
MNKWQAMVGEFHRKFGQPINASGFPSFSRTSLRITLINEECNKELIPAMIREDMAETTDAMCDLIYVVLGTAMEMGIDLEPFFNEVHRTNMLKEGGAVREDGKILKPEGWKPPRIAEMIAEGAGLIR